MEEEETPQSNQPAESNEDPEQAKSAEKEPANQVEENAGKTSPQLKTEEPEETEPVNKAEIQSTDDHFHDVPPAEIDPETLKKELEEANSKLASLKELFDDCEKKIEKAAEVSGD